MADLVYEVQMQGRSIAEFWRDFDEKAAKAATNATKQVQSVEKEVSKLGVEAKKAGKEMEDGFSNIGKSASASGVQIGAISGVVSSLVTEFINLGKQAVDVLVQIGEKSVETALEFDRLKIQLQGLFKGSPEAAEEAFNFIRAKSKELGVDLSELASAFLPKSENLKQFEEIAKIATVLKSKEPVAGETSARIALTEAFSGNLSSLQKRFEFVTPQDIERIKQLQKEEGNVQGLIDGLNQTLKENGLSFENVQKTAENAFARVGAVVQDFEGTAGKPIVESLQDISDKILAFVDANQEDLTVFADTIGRAIAEALDLIAGIDFGQIDTKTLIDIADYAFRIVEALKIASTQVATFLQAFSNLPGISQLIDALGYGITHLDDALITFSQIIALVNAELAAFEAASNKAAVGLDLIQAGLDSASLNYGKVIEDLKSAQAKLNDNADAQTAYNDSIQASQQQFEDYKKSLQDNTKAQDDLRDSLKEQAAAGTDAADAILEAGAADRQAAEDADKLKEAQDKVNKAMADAEKDLGRKIEDINTAFERKRLDIAIEFAQKREDAARANVEKLADIEKKYGQEVDDAQKDLSRKEEDIARKYGEQRIDLEREQRQKRVDIEREYRLKLQDIQRQFLLDADEAEKNRDAVAFLRAMKERDKQVQDAQTQRDRDIKETQLTGQQKKQELDLQRQRELEDARIANERKLEDLKTNLDRQIEAQNTAYARQIEDLQIGEARKLEEAQTARQRDIDDAKLAYERKISDLQESLAAELEVLKAGNAALEEENARHNDEMGSGHTTVAQRITDLQQIGLGSSSNTPTHPAAGSGQAQGSHPGSIPGFASGGFVTHGRPYIVGERGPELFRPNVNGQIVPNHALMTSGFSAPSVVSNNNYYNNKSASLGGLLDAGSLDALLAAKVQNYLVQLLSNM